MGKKDLALKEFVSLEHSPYGGDKNNPCKECEAQWPCPYENARVASNLVNKAEEGV